MTRAYVDLVKAAKRGSVLAVTDLGTGYQIGHGRWAGETITGLWDRKAETLVFERPNYDYGFLFDRLHTDWLGQDVYSQTLQEGFNRLREGGFFLPQPRSAYVFRCLEDTLDWDRTYCVLLDEKAGGIKGTIFIRQQAPSGPYRSWIRDAASFCLSTGDTIHVTFDIPHPTGGHSALEAIKSRTKVLIHDVVTATMLLTLPPTTVQTSLGRSPGLDNFNRNRKLGVMRLEAPHVVTVNRVALGNQRFFPASCQPGAPKSPHERRAHLRTLGRGTGRERVVKVKATSINGGRSLQPYRVIT